MTISCDRRRYKARGDFARFHGANRRPAADGFLAPMERFPRRLRVTGWADLRVWAAAAALVVFAFAAGASGLGGWNQGRGKTPPAAPPAPVAVPFAPGERLEYAASWNGTVTAATFKLAVVERRDFFGRMAWHFQAQAKTIDPVRMIFTLDDQFDSYTDAITLESRQYEAYLREQAKNEDLVVPMASKAETDRGNMHVYLVLAGTQ